MSVDLGKARTGIAVSDAGEGFAFPKTVICEYNEQRLVQKIADCAAGYAAGLIVVGLPVNMDGSHGERAADCERIARDIAEASSVKTVMWDERCTTVSAHAALNVTDTRGAKRKAVVDAVAATIILEDYLKYRKNSAEH